jgi:hypothetical protein
VPALNARRGAFGHVGAIRTLAFFVACVACGAGCKPKATGAQCDQLLERYAELVVTEHFGDASTEQIKTEREREKSEARGDDAFKNCSSEVSQAEFDCAMHATSADAVEKCLE